MGDYLIAFILLFPIAPLLNRVAVALERIAAEFDGQPDRLGMSDMMHSIMENGRKYN